MMRKAIALALLLIILVPPPVSAQLRGGSERNQEGRARLQKWLSEWLDEEAVTLKVPLYTLEFTIALLGKASRTSSGITTISPQFRIAYVAEFPPDGATNYQLITAESPTLLKERVAARTAVLRVNGLRVNPPPPVLKTYPAGTTMIVSPVVWDNGVSLSLFDSHSRKPTDGARQFSDEETQVGVVYVNDLVGVTAEFGQLERIIRRLVAAPNAPTPPVGGDVGRSSAHSLGLTKAGYNVAAEGMTYSDVVEILGLSGEEVSRSVLDGSVTVMYVWKSADGSNMSAIFQAGRLVSKAQVGLK